MARPTKYSEAFVPKVEELLYNGKSIIQVARELRVCKQTIYSWGKKHKKFLDAIKKGVEWSEGWWMNQGQDNIYNKDFNSTLWYMNMKNRFQWRDQQHIEHKIEADVKSEGILKQMTDDQLKDYLSNTAENKS